MAVYAADVAVTVCWPAVDGVPGSDHYAACSRSRSREAGCGELAAMLVAEPEGLVDREMVPMVAQVSALCWLVLVCGLEQVLGLGLVAAPSMVEDPLG